MKTLLTLSASTALLFTMASAVAGDNTCVGNQNCQDNSTTNEGGTGVGVGVGIGIGVGKGGEGGEGGNATIERGAIDNDNTNVNVNSASAEANASAKQGQLQGQIQGQYQSNYSKSGVKGSGNSNVYIDASERTNFPASTAIAPTATGTCQSFLGGAGQSDTLGVSGLIPISSNWCRIVSMMNWLAVNVSVQAGIRYGCISEDDFADAVGESLCNAPVTVIPRAEKPVASLNYQPMQPVN
jgi:hypothetical protein